MMSVLQALIFANGEPNDGAMVQRALDSAPEALVIAADGGARIAAYFGRVPHVVVGDMDSITVQQLQALESVHADIRRHPPEKDETDLELALQVAAERGACWIRIIGAIGSRFDQVLANVYLMAQPELAGCDIQMVAGKQAMRLLRAGEHLIEGAEGDTVSLIPIMGDALNVTTEGLYYPLKGETLRFGPARGVSNVLKGERAQVRFEGGMLLVVHTIGRA